MHVGHCDQVARRCGNLCGLLRAMCWAHAQAEAVGILSRIVDYLIVKIFENILKNPPFTTQQLRALIAGDKFEVIPWWDIFNVRPTKFNEAIKETFSDDRYSKISLKF